MSNEKDLITKLFGVKREDYEKIIRADHDKMAIITLDAYLRVLTGIITKELGYKLSDIQQAAKTIVDDEIDKELDKVFSHSEGELS